MLRPVGRWLLVPLQVNSHRINGCVERWDKTQTCPTFYFLIDYHILFFLSNNVIAKESLICSDCQL